MAATTNQGAGRRHRSGPKPRVRVPGNREVANQDNDREAAAYHDGRDGHAPPPPEAPQALHDAYHAGRQSRADEEGEDAMARNRQGAETALAGRERGKEQPPSKTPGQRSSSGSGSLSVTDDGATFLLGLIAYSLAINYLRYGWAGVTGWFSAKFTNNVTLTGPTATTNSGQAVLIPNANPGTGAAAPQAGGALA